VVEQFTVSYVRVTALYSLLLQPTNAITPAIAVLFFCTFSVFSMSLFNGVSIALLFSESTLLYLLTQCRERRWLEQKKTLLSSGGD